MASDSRNSRLIAAIVDILHERRESLGMSKKKLAQVCGITRTAIILMERHERQPSLDLVLRIANGLDVSLSKVIAEAERRIAKSGKGEP